MRDPPRTPASLTVSSRSLWRGAPLRLARLQRAHPVGTRLVLTITGGEARARDVRDLLVGAGFAAPVVGEGTAQARRARTLPDFVAPDLRLLVCGLNPSLHAADAGVGFAGPGNRFWPAAVASGLIAERAARDPLATLREHRIGMTDLLKRATPAASALRPAEYRAGAARVERLVRRLAPAAIVFVGLAGYRAAVDRTARPGPQPSPFGGAPAYVMPSTSGLNAATSLGDLTAHLRAALRTR